MKLIPTPPRASLWSVWVLSLDLVERCDVDWLYQVLKLGDLLFQEVRPDLTQFTTRVTSWQQRNKTRVARTRGMHTCREELARVEVTVITPGTNQHQRCCVDNGIRPAQLHHNSLLTWYHMTFSDLTSAAWLLSKSHTSENIVYSILARVFQTEIAKHSSA